MSAAKESGESAPTKRVLSRSPIQEGPPVSNAGLNSSSSAPTALVAIVATALYILLWTWKTARRLRIRDKWGFSGAFLAGEDTVETHFSRCGHQVIAEDQGLPETDALNVAVLTAPAGRGPRR